MPFAVTWMDLEIVIHTEVSQKEKDKYHIISFVHGIQKNGTDELICKAEIRVTDVENKLMVTKRGKGDGKNWEVEIDIHTFIYIKQITNEKLLYTTGNSTQCSVVTYMGRKYKKEWIYVYV